MDITVEVEAWKGTKDLGLNEYVATWTEQVRPLCLLATDLESMDIIHAMENDIKAMAVKRFFELYTAQNA